jgi:tetratricopeptide (TPR) repeat protein
LGAAAEFRRAIELNLNYASAHQWFADVLSALGRHDEALVEMKRAQQIDPLSPIINALLVGRAVLSAPFWKTGQVADGALNTYRAKSVIFAKISRRTELNRRKR